MTKLIKFSNFTKLWNDINEWMYELLVNNKFDIITYFKNEKYFSAFNLCDKENTTVYSSFMANDICKKL